MLSANRLRLLDETLREGDSRGYHRHPPEERLALLRRIHEVTGIRHFSLGFAVVNDSDRETLFAFLAAQRQGKLPPDLVAHVYGWYQIEDRAHALLRSIAPADRRSVSFHSACSASEAIARPTDGSWLAAQRGAGFDPHKLSAAELHAGLQEQLTLLTRRYFQYGLHSVGGIIQDAFRCTPAELHGYVAALQAAGCREIRLHDTVGVATPLGVAERLPELQARFAGLEFFGHFHDDLGMAVANTLTALACGAAGADVTINGVGNRAGNAATAAVLMALRTIYGLSLPGVAYEQLTSLSRQVEQYFVLLQSPHAAVTGSLLHLDEATVRTHLMQTVSPTTYLPYDPKEVGGHIAAAYAPGSGRRAVELAFSRCAESLHRHAISVDEALVDRAWTWVQQQTAARAATQRPRALQAMADYQQALVCSYVTDDDLIAATLASAGQFAPAERKDAAASGERPELARG